MMNHEVVVSGEPFAAGDDAWLDVVSASFTAALGTSPSMPQQEYLVAGRRVQLRAAHPELMRRLSRSFTHLETTVSADPELVIYLWDSAICDAPWPPTPNVGDEQAPGAFFYYRRGDVQAGFQLGGGAEVRAGGLRAPTPALSVVDTRRNTAWYWAADARRIPYWDEAAPFRFVLDWWLRARGIHRLHAGAVGTPEGGVLLTGKSGSGKSTSTLACLESPLQYAGDDYVAVAVEPQPWVYSLYSSGKLAPNHVERLPFLQAALANGDDGGEEKTVVYVHEHWPDNIVSDFPLRAILTSKIVPGLVDARISEISPLAGLAALAPSTVLQIHTRGQSPLAGMRQLVQRLPTFSLELGSNIRSIPEAIADLLTRLNTRPS